MCLQLRAQQNRSFLIMVHIFKIGFIDFILKRYFICTEIIEYCRGEPPFTHTERFGPLIQTFGAKVPLNCSRGWYSNRSPLEATCTFSSSIQGIWQANGNCDSMPNIFHEFSLYLPVIWLRIQHRSCIRILLSSMSHHKFLHSFKMESSLLQ